MHIILYVSEVGKIDAITQILDAAAILKTNIIALIMTDFADRQLKNYI